MAAHQSAPHTLAAWALVGILRHILDGEPEETCCHRAGSGEAPGLAPYLR
jgi:hypothetical protein